MNVETLSNETNMNIEKLSIKRNMKIETLSKMKEKQIDTTNKKVESPKTDMKTQTGRLMVAVIVVPVVITVAHWLIAAVSGRYC